MKGIGRIVKQEYDVDDWLQVCCLKVVTHVSQLGYRLTCKCVKCPILGLWVGLECMFGLVVVIVNPSNLILR